MQQQPNPIEMAWQNDTEKTYFASEVSIGNMVAIRKDKKANVKKEAHIMFAFMDIFGPKPKIIGKFIVTIEHAKGIMQILNQKIIEAEKELASKELPKISTKIGKDTTTTRYIG